MSEASKRGPLIQKKSKPSTLERPKPVIVNNQSDFKFSSSEVKKEKLASKTPSIPTKSPLMASEAKETGTPISKDTKDVKRDPIRKVKSVVGKNNNVKSIKVPNDLHIKIGVLGKFMDENKTYAILSELVDYYARNELTDRQQKQFDYMTEFFNDTPE